MHKYNKATTKYKDVPMEDKIFSYLDKQNTNEADKLSMLLCYLSMPAMCYSWVNEDDFNSLLEKYKIDITPYVKDDERITTSVKSEIAGEMFKLIDTGKYKKKNLIKALREKFPEVNSGVICRLIKKNMNLRLIEIDRTYKTKPYVIKGKYFIK
jgi:replicative superfamily II helicase